MIAHKISFGLVILLLAMVARPAVTALQATDKNLGIIRLRYVTIVVRDYDEALRWYTDVLGLEKTEEGSFGKGQRWIVVASPGQRDLGIILEIAQPYSVGTNMAPATGATASVITRPASVAKPGGSLRSRIAAGSTTWLRNGA